MCTENPTFLSLGFSARDRDRFSRCWPVALPVASKPVSTAAPIIVEEKEELGALEKTLVPVMYRSFHELYEENRRVPKTLRKRILRSAGSNRYPLSSSPAAEG
jgi:hypothetical protein